MFAKFLLVSALVALTAAAAVKEDDVPNVGGQDERPKEGVDPNTLSCDKEGQVFLLLPHFSDCKKFFMCANGKEVLFSCPTETIFDFELQGCDWESSGKCILREPRDDDIEGSGDDDIEGSGDDEDVQGYWQPEEEESYAVESDSAKPESGGTPVFAGVLDCRRAHTAARQVPYKGDCQRFWRCVDGASKTAYCSDGLFFNAQTQQCDFEANAKCDTQVETELEGEYIVYQ